MSDPVIDVADVRDFWMRVALGLKDEMVVRLNRIDALEAQLHTLKLAAEALVDATPNCSCSPAWKDRGLRHPDCILCNLQPEWDALVDALKVEL